MTLTHRIHDLVQRIVALEATRARRNHAEVTSRPGAPSEESAIRRAEQVRGVTFPPDYRAFLAHHDGWNKLAWGTWLYSIAELSDDNDVYAYARECLSEMADDGEVPPELLDATVIGASENDASLVLLLATGEVVEWLSAREPAVRRGLPRVPPDPTR